MQKIKTFQELFEAVKKLYPDEKVNKVFLLEFIASKFYNSNYHKSNKFLSLMIQIQNYKIFNKTKISRNFQKIYNLIKAIKETE